MMNAIYLMAFLLASCVLVFCIDWVLTKFKLKGKHETKFLWLTVAFIIILFMVVFGIDGYESLGWEDRVLRR